MDLNLGRLPMLPYVEFKSRISLTGSCSQGWGFFGRCVCQELFQVKVEVLQVGYNCYFTLGFHFRPFLEYGGSEWNHPQCVYLLKYVNELSKAKFHETPFFNVLKHCETFWNFVKLCYWNFNKNHWNFIPFQNHWNFATLLIRHLQYFQYFFEFFVNKSKFQ